MKHKLTRETEDLIKRICSNLPESHYQAIEKRTMKGKDLKLSDEKEIRAQLNKMGKDLEDEKDYTIKVPFYNTINHKRRLRKAFQQKGMDGILEYVEPFTKRASERNLRHFVLENLKKYDITISGVRKFSIYSNMDENSFQEILNEFASKYSRGRSVTQKRFSRFVNKHRFGFRAFASDEDAKKYVLKNEMIESRHLD